LRKTLLLEASASNSDLVKEVTLDFERVKFLADAQAKLSSVIEKRRYGAVLPS
jgi:hypothetical protein